MMTSDSPRSGFRGSGGTEGGIGLFAVGLGLSLISLWLFLDSVQVTTAGFGWVTGVFGRATTTSAGIIFLPFFLGVCALFYDVRQVWAWWVTLIGLGLIVIEIVSRIQFLMTMKTSHFLLMVVLFAAGTGLMLRSYRPMSSSQ